MKCTDVLMKEHKIILRALEVLDQMASRVAEGQPVDAGDVQALLRFLRKFGDDLHQAKEESALFPELMRTAAANQPALKQMLFEHDQERSLVEGLEDSLRTQKGGEFAQLAGRLRDLLRTHILKEDTILFEIVEQSLSPEQDERVTRGFNQFQISLDFLADLRRLEWTYLRRAA